MGMSKTESHLIDNNNRIRRISNYARAHRGGAGPTGPAGPGGAERTTLLVITQYSPSGTAFFVNSGSTHYTYNLEAGDLGSSETIYLNKEAIQIYFRGTKLLKTEHTQWLSQFSFILNIAVDIDDYIEILS